MTEAQEIENVQRHFMLTHPGQVAFNVPWSQMINTWHSLRRSGNSPTDIFKYWKRQGVSVDVASTFTAAMKQTDAGQIIQDPMERPSWAEAYNEGLGKGVSKIPWGTLIMVGLAYAFVTQGLPRMLKNE